MPTIKPCPKSCAFNWVAFHQQLDMALAHFIDEQDALPSKTDMVEFAKFSNGKKMLQERGEFLPEDESGN